jgi:uncharacterized RDD family membrane protein YckC
MKEVSMAATKTPAVKQTEMEYVGFWVRTGAWFIDLILLALAALGLLIVPYFVGLWSWRGQTLGQMAAHIKVVRQDGKPMDLGTAVLRFIGYVVCVLTLGIGFLMIAFDGQKRGLHDRLAGTYVIPFAQG